MNESDKLTYREVREKLSDGLNKIALYGNSDEIQFNEDHITPELSNIGSFEKCWKLFDDGWYMIKKGTLKENFAEVSVSKIGIELGFKETVFKIIENNYNLLKEGLG